MPATVDYLGSDWLAEADALVRPIEPLDRSLSVAFDIRDEAAAAGYVLELGPGPVAIRPIDTTDEPASPPVDVRLRMDRATAVAIATGAVSAQRAFLDGRIELGGDVRDLLDGATHLREVDDHLAPLRTRTAF